jgi:hypothetical protein
MKSAGSREYIKMVPQIRAASVMIAREPPDPRLSGAGADDLPNVK